MRSQFSLVIDDSTREALESISVGLTMRLSARWQLSSKVGYLAGCLVLAICVCQAMAEVTW